MRETITWIFAWCLLSILSVPALAGDDKTDADYWANLGDSQMAARQYKDAVYSYTAAIVKGPETPDLHAKRGRAHYQLGSYKVALAELDTAIAADAKRADYFNDRGLIRHALEDYRSATADYTKSLKLKPKDAAVLTNRAAAYARLRESDKTQRDLDRALSISPDYGPALLERVWLLIDGSRPEGVHAELQAITSFAPLDASALAARATAHYHLGNWKTAIMDADRAIALGSEPSWIYSVRAWAKIQLGDYEEAVADANILITRSRNSIPARFTRAVALQFAGRTEAALADMDAALRIDFAEAYRRRTYLNITAGRMKEALGDARQSVAFAPFSESSAAILGAALLENGEPSAAVAECGKSLQIRETVGGYVCRARARLALNQYAAARLDMKQALKLNGLSGDVYYVSGRIDLAQGKAASALQKFEQASKLEMSNRAGLFMHRGDAERALGKIKKARSQYLTARKFDFGRYTQALNKRLADLPPQ